MRSSASCTSLRRMMADSVSGRNSRPATGRPKVGMAHAPLDERGDAVGLLQGHVERRLADDGAAVVEQQHGAGRQHVAVAVGQRDGLAVVVQVAMAEKVVPRSMPTSLPVPPAMPYPLAAVEVDERERVASRRGPPCRNCNRVPRRTEEVNNLKEKPTCSVETPSLLASGACQRPGGKMYRGVDTPRSPAFRQSIRASMPFVKDCFPLPADYCVSSIRVEAPVEEAPSWSVPSSCVVWAAWAHASWNICMPPTCRW